MQLRITKFLFLFLFLFFICSFVGVKEVDAFAGAYGRIYTVINGVNVGIDNITVTSQYSDGTGGPSVSTYTPGGGGLLINGGDTPGGGEACGGEQYYNTLGESGWYSFVGGGPFCSPSGWDCGHGVPIITPQAPSAATLTAMGLPTTGHYNMSSYDTGQGAGFIANNATFGHIHFIWVSDAPPAASISGPTTATTNVAIAANAFTGTHTAGSGNITNATMYVVRADRASFTCDSPNTAVPVSGTSNPNLDALYCFINQSPTISGGNATTRNNAWTPSASGTYYVGVDTVAGNDSCTGNPFLSGSQTNSMTSIGRFGCGSGSYLTLSVGAASTPTPTPTVVPVTITGLLIGQGNNPTPANFQNASFDTAGKQSSQGGKNWRNDMRVTLQAGGNPTKYYVGFTDRSVYGNEMANFSDLVTKTSDRINGFLLQYDQAVDTYYIHSGTNPDSGWTEIPAGGLDVSNSQNKLIYTVASGDQGAQWRIYFYSDYGSRQMRTSAYVSNASGTQNAFSSQLNPSPSP